MAKKGAEQSNPVFSRLWTEFRKTYFPRTGLKGLLEEIQDRYSLTSHWQYRISPDEKHPLCGIIEFAKPHFMLGASDTVKQLVITYLQEQGYSQDSETGSIFTHNKEESLFLHIYEGETSFSVSLMPWTKKIR